MIFHSCNPGWFINTVGLVIDMIMFPWRRKKRLQRLPKARTEEKP